MPAFDLQPDTTLVLKAARVLHREAAGADGAPVLHMFYGEHQITFEGDTLAFGRGLVGQSRFPAGDARSWCDGEPRPWPDVRALLDALLEAGILSSDDGVDAPPPPPSLLQRTAPSSPVPPLRWESISDLCALFAGTRDAPPAALIESTLGPGLLAQVVRDPSGRQSGENTLAMTAPALADPIPTEWRRCRYAGSRFDDPRPMNVSGLRQMAGDFEGMLGRIAQLRHAFLARTGRSRPGLVDLWLLSWICFVAPAWDVRRAGGSINGAVAEWTTALSKTFGGIKMTLQMLLVRDGCDPGATITAGDFIRVTEEQGRLLSDTGVCAGTPLMIERVVEACVAGGEHPTAPPIVDLDSLLDYGIATAPLPLVAAARDARSRALVGAAGLDSDAIARELAELAYREGEASPILQRALDLAAVLGVDVDPGSTPLASTERFDDAGAPLLLALLGIEAQALQLAEHHQRRVVAALGTGEVPRLRRRHVAAGLVPLQRRLWSDYVAAHHGWTVDEDPDGGVIIVAGGRRVRAQSSTSP